MTPYDNYIRCMREAGRNLAQLNWYRRHKPASIMVRWTRNDIAFWNRQAAAWRRIEKLDKELSAK